jgi:predicted RNA-binding Zn-ribbon protein involved in translation (DUF1610 family)
MAGDTEFSSPSDFRGNFGGYIEQVQRELEAHHGEDSGSFPTVVERAQAEAPYFAARNWLVEKWGEHFPCPVCGNVEWTVSEVGPAVQPAAYLTFHVICGYCGNAMQVVPGQAYLDTPTIPQQLQVPAPEK